VAEQAALLIPLRKLFALSGNKHGEIKNNNWGGHPPEENGESTSSGITVISGNIPGQSFSICASSNVFRNTVSIAPVIYQFSFKTDKTYL